MKVSKSQKNIFKKTLKKYLRNLKKQVKKLG